MLLLRLVATALCATFVVLLVNALPVRVALVAPLVIPERASPGRAARDAPAGATRGAPGDAAVSVVDVASGVSPSQIAGMIKLRRGEYILAVDDRAANTDDEAGALIEAVPPRPGRFVDLTVSRGTTERRVLVLMH